MRNDDPDARGEARGGAAAANGAAAVVGVRSPDGPKVTLSPHPNRESLDAAIAPPTALLFRNRLKGTDKLTRRPGLAPILHQ